MKQRAIFYLESSKIHAEKSVDNETIKNIERKEMRDTHCEEVDNVI